MVFALVVSALLAGAAFAHADSSAPASEHYLVVDGQQLGQYWRFTVPPAKLPPRNVLKQHPSGCAAISVRIEPDGTPHQMKVLKSQWTPMLPAYQQIMDARMVDQIQRAHFAPGPKNLERMPAYSYIVTTFFSLPAFSSNPSAYTQARAKNIEAKLTALCRIPDFVARVARATAAPLPSKVRTNQS